MSLQEAFAYQLENNPPCDGNGDKLLYFLAHLEPGHKLNVLKIWASELPKLEEQYVYLYTPFYSKLPKLKRITRQTTQATPGTPIQTL